MKKVYNYSCKILYYYKLKYIAIVRYNFKWFTKLQHLICKNNEFDSKFDFNVISTTIYVLASNNYDFQSSWPLYCRSILVVLFSQWQLPTPISQGMTLRMCHSHKTWIIVLKVFFEASLKWLWFKDFPKTTIIFAVIELKIKLNW